jgi:hypothetical protein
MTASNVVSTIKRQIQGIDHDPKKGVMGDCWRTCVAMICGVDRDAVPHDHVDYTPDEWREWREDVGRSLGFKIVQAGFQCGDLELEEVIKLGLHTGFGQPFILTGISKRRWDHSVAIDELGVQHDPCVDGHGLQGPARDGLYWMEWIVRPYRTA